MARPRRPFEHLDQRALDSMRRGEDAAWLNWNPELFDAGQLQQAWLPVLRAQRDETANIPLAVYMHFSYCRRSCSFCMYHHSVPKGREPYELLAVAQVQRLNRLVEEVGRVPAKTAYWGGGTPTAMPADLLGNILDAHGRAFKVAGEFTVEAHPQTLTPELLRMLAAGGVNRLSVGLQSLDPAVLKTITRRNRHLDELAELMRTSVEVDVDVNMDLVAGLPGQSLTSLQRDIGAIVAMRPRTLTVYRYQPVRTLPTSSVVDMSADRVFAGEVLEALDGYHGFATPYSVVLFRAAGEFQLHTAESLAEGGMIDSVAAAGVEYHEYDGEVTHLLGLGPGAVSHLVGYAWYREVTLQAALSESSVYCGTRLSLEDEYEQQLRRELNATGTASWSEASGRAKKVLTAGVSEGVLQELGGQVGWARDDGAEARRRLLERLMPSVAEDTKLPMLWPENADPTLSMIPGAPAGTAEPSAERQSGPKPPSDTLAHWCRLLEVPGVGAAYEGAQVVRLQEDRIEFEWLSETTSSQNGEQTPFLRLMVEDVAEGKPSFAASTRFAVSYVGKEYEDLGTVERELLRLLVDKTLALDRSSR